MSYVYPKKLIRTLSIILLLITSGFLLKAQDGNYAGGIDESRVSFGFSVQYINTESIIFKVDDWQDPFFDPILNRFTTGNLRSIRSNIAGGFAITGIANINIVEDIIDLRYSPGVITARYTIIYEYLDPDGLLPASERTRFRDYKVFGFQSPIELRLRSKRYRNVRASIFSGLSFNINFNRGAFIDDSERVGTARQLRYTASYLSYEVGMGMEIYFEYFRFLPEVKLSYGLTNVIQHDNTPYAVPIRSLIPKSITFSFYFQ